MAVDKITGPISELQLIDKTNEIIDAIPTSTTQLTNDSGYITGITSNMVTSALGFTPASSSNVVTLSTDQEITGIKTFTGEKRIKFKQSGTSTKLGFTLYDSSNREKGYLEFNPSNKVDNIPLMTLGNYAEGSTNLTHVGFRKYSGVSGANGAYNLLTPLVSDAKAPFTLTTTYTNFYFPLGFSDGSTTVRTAKSGVVDLSGLGFITGITSSDVTTALGYTPANTYSTTNPALTSSNDVCSWAVTHNLGDNVEIHVYNSTTKKEVLANVALTSSSVATIELFSTSDLASGAFKVVVIGK